MASHQRHVSTSGARDKTYFEQQREALVDEIAMNFENVLANINKLNRSLEAVIAVGHEFSSVEALWSQFENVMAKAPENGKGDVDGEVEGRRGEENEGGGAREDVEGRTGSVGDA